MSGLPASGILCQHDAFVKSFCLEKDLGKTPWKCPVVAEPSCPPHPSPRTLWETQSHSRGQDRPPAGHGDGPVLWVWMKAERAPCQDFGIKAASSLCCATPACGLSLAHRSLYKPH